MYHNWYKNIKYSFFRIKDKNWCQKLQNYLLSGFSMDTCQILKTKDKSILLGMIQEIELFILCFVAPCNLLVVGKILWIRGISKAVHEQCCLKIGSHNNLVPSLVCTRQLSTVGINPRVSDLKEPGTSKLDWRYLEHNKIDRNELQIWHRNKHC